MKGHFEKGAWVEDECIIEVSLPSYSNVKVGDTIKYKISPCIFDNYLGSAILRDLMR